MDEVKVTIVISGVKQPGWLAARVIVNSLKRAMFLLDGIPGQFSARIDGPDESIELDEDRQWQRVRDSNSRGH